MQKSFIQELDDLCKVHDWTYEQSDDYSVWKRGSEQRKAIGELQKKCWFDGYTYEQIHAVLTKYHN